MSLCQVECGVATHHARRVPHALYFCGSPSKEGRAAGFDDYVSMYECTTIMLVFLNTEKKSM